MSTDKSTGWAHLKRPRVYAEKKGQNNFMLTPTAKSWLAEQRELMGARSYADVIEKLARLPRIEPPRDRVTVLPRVEPID